MEEAIAKPVATEVTPEATPAAVPDTANWYDGAPDATDKDRESKSLNDYVKSHNALRTMIDKKGIIPPGEGASADDMSAFRASVEQHLGKDAFKAEVPGADAYDVKAILENTALTDDRRTGIFEKFNAIGLDNDQANGVMDMFAEQSGLDLEMVKEFNTSSRKESETLYKEQWGDDFTNRLAGADTVAEKNAELLSKLEKVGMAGDPDVIRLFDEVARATSEDAPENSDARRASAQGDYDEYIKSDEYRNMTARDSGYSAGMPEYDAVLTKARSYLIKANK